MAYSLGFPYLSCGVGDLGYGIKLSFSSSANPHDNLRSKAHFSIDGEDFLMVLMGIWEKYHKQGEPYYGGKID